MKEIKRKSEINNLTVITAHFADFDWTKMLVERINSLVPKSKLLELIIINQDRTEESTTKLKQISPDAIIKIYPRNEQLFELQGHDHASVLTKALNEAKGNFICVIDSDAHPINQNWIKSCEDILAYYDAILANVPGKMTESHPCFMLFKRKLLDLDLSFELGIHEKESDTGRRLGKYLLTNGVNVYFANAAPAFNGYYGWIYLESIYHHRSGTFWGASDARIKAQISWDNEYFKEIVIKSQRYYLTVKEYLKFKLHSYLFKKLSR